MEKGVVRRSGWNCGSDVLEWVQSAEDGYETEWIGE